MEFLWFDMAGHMNADTTKYYYLKDHLGSTRAVLNSTNTVISAQDYDVWGYLLENRSYESQNVKYKFTGKERDKDLESNYDYFGARYYDSRVANWTSVDPLLEKHFDFTPYNYVLRNPIILLDPNGKQIKFSNNEETRSQEIQLLQNLLPVEYSQYIAPATSDNSNFYLDPGLLAEGSETVHGNSMPSEYGELLKLSESSETIAFNFVDENTKFSAWVYGEENVQTTGQIGTVRDNKVAVGYTLVSGNINNQQLPEYTSRSGSTEIYILKSFTGIALSKRQMTISMGHELLGHAYPYIMGARWRHIPSEPSNSGFEEGIKFIEERAERSYKKHL